MNDCELCVADGYNIGANVGKAAGQNRKVPPDRGNILSLL
jgi:hypothetical protein